MALKSNPIGASKPNSKIHHARIFYNRDKSVLSLRYSAAGRVKSPGDTKTAALIELTLEMFVTTQAVPMIQISITMVRNKFIPFQFDASLAFSSFISTAP